MSEHTSFYEKIGITPLINASETYTNLGGSLMDERTVEAMRQRAFRGLSVASSESK